MGSDVEVFSCLLGVVLYLFSTISLFLVLIYSNLSVFSAWLYVCLMTGSHRVHKRLSDSLEMELWMVADHHVCSGN